jgi:hypothetical protein
MTVPGWVHSDEYTYYPLKIIDYEILDSDAGMV